MKKPAIFAKLKSNTNSVPEADAGQALNPHLPEPFDPKQLDGRYTAPASTEPSAVQPADRSDPELDAASALAKRKLPTLNLSALWSESFSLLTFQTGSFGLRGCLIRNERFQASIVAVAESSNIDFTRAIAEVIGGLKKQHKRLPKKAILLTPNVVSDVITLPVSPLRPRNDEQMQELIRWELEGAVTQQNKHWLLGSMLVERGYLIVAQRDEIVTELQIRQAQGGQAALTRFGELAIQLGYISREQLEECFALQGKLVAVDDDLVYGWQAEENLNQAKDPFSGLSDEILLSQADDENSSHRWLVCGISRTVRQRWIGAFNLNGLQLEAFYPSVGAAFATMSLVSNHPVQMLLEIQQEQIACISGTQQGITNIQISGRNSIALDAAECFAVLGVLPSDLKQLHICAPSVDGDIDAIVQEIDSQIAQEVISLQVPDALPIPQDQPADLNTQALSGILGAANHFLNHVPQARLSWISARIRNKNRWKAYTQPKVLIPVTLAVVATLMLGSLTWLYTEMWHQQGRLAELDAHYNKQIVLKNQFAKLVSEENELGRKIRHIQSEISETTAGLNQATIGGIRDRNLALTVLKSIGITITSGVKLSSLKQVASTFTLKAQARSDTEALEFVTMLNKTLLPIEYQVFDSQMKRSTQLNINALPYQLTIILDAADQGAKK